MHHSEITKVVLVYCNIVNNDYQQDSRVWYTFALNESFGQLLDISPKKYIFKTFNSEISYIEAWFTDENSKLLEKEDKINITLVIIWRVTHKNIALYNWAWRFYICERHRFLYFAKNMVTNMVKKCKSVCKCIPWKYSLGMIALCQNLPNPNEQTDTKGKKRQLKKQ